MRVIDYKSGRKSWDLNDIINGRDLQITLYMAAVRELLKRQFKEKEISPQEMFYYALHDPIIDKDKLKKKTVEEALKEELKLSGVKERDKIEKLIPYVVEKAEGIGRMITSGDIRVQPAYRESGSSGCDYCKYKAVCGFDRRIPGYKYKTEKKYDEEKAWQIINGQMNN